MRVIHLSYRVPKPKFTDPEAWLKRISFSVVVMESMADYSEVIGIYHIDYEGVLTKNQVTYHFPGFNRWQLLLPFQFNRYVAKLKPRAIIVHGLIFPWQIIMLRWQVGSGVKIIAQHHAERPLKDFRQYLQQWADRYIKAYMFASIELGMRWVEKGQIRDSMKIKEIIGTSSIFNPIQKKVAKSFTKVSEGKIFLWVGRLDTNKDPITLIKAFSQFSIKNSNVHLYVIFQGDELIEEVKMQVMTFKAEAQITLVGKVEHDDLLYWYNSADFIISSSHYEGSGIAICEAMSCGCIPILTNIPSFQMMTNGGRIGFLYEPGDENGLRNAVTQSLSLDQLSERKKVLRHFNAALSGNANARKIMDVIYE
ncbi:MAG: glycosyltransferase family 4 protein [Bacteroidia bacterium]|nr:glycosyltransferase family 4 protein [Bacteroidia bacterium]